MELCGEHPLPIVQGKTRQQAQSVPVHCLILEVLRHVCIRAYCLMNMYNITTVVIIQSLTDLRSTLAIQYYY